MNVEVDFLKLNKRQKTGYVIQYDPSNSLLFETTYNLCNVKFGDVEKKSIVYANDSCVSVLPDNLSEYILENYKKRNLVQVISDVSLFANRELIIKEISKNILEKYKMIKL